MMRAVRYFLSRLKSHIKASPTVIIIALLTASAVALLASAVIKNAAESSEDSEKLFELGVVGDLEQRYIDLAIDTMNNLDSSRFSLSFVAMSEDEAISGIRSGRLYAYIRVPPGFVDAAARAEFIPVQLVSEGSDTALEESILKEFVKVAEKLADVTQKSVFGTENYLAEKGLKWSEIGEISDPLALTYAEYLLNRTEILEIDNVGDGDVTAGVYYFSSFSLFFAMLFGIGCAAHLVRRDMSLPKLLYARRVGAARQVVSEYAAYFIFMYAFIFILLVIGGSVLSGKEIADAFGGASFGDFALFALKIAPAAAMIAAMQLFLYECVDGVVGGVLLQFVAAISISYVSGYFYPSGFFPRTVQKIALVLPGGVAFTYARRAFAGTAGVSELLPVLAYALLFVALTAAVRKLKLGGDGA